MEPRSPSWGQRHRTGQMQKTQRQRSLPRDRWSRRGRASREMPKFKGPATGPWLRSPHNNSPHPQECSPPAPLPLQALPKQTEDPKLRSLPRNRPVPPNTMAPGLECKASPVSEHLVPLALVLFGRGPWLEEAGHWGWAPVGSQRLSDRGYNVTSSLSFSTMMDWTR